MRRKADILLVVLLGVALIQAAFLALGRAGGGEGRVALPLLAEGDPPGALHAEDGAPRLLRARVAAVGDYLTVEDLARGVLLLERGELPGVPPLSPRERARIAELLARADAHRAELLRTEAEIARTSERLAEVAREIAAGLTPEQRAWVVRQRDQVSVGQVERRYWDEVLHAVGGER